MQMTPNYIYLSNKIKQINQDMVFGPKNFRDMLSNHIVTLDGKALAASILLISQHHIIPTEHFTLRVQVYLWFHNSLTFVSVVSYC